MDVAIAVENSDAIKESDYDDIKRFIKQLIRQMSSSENSVHFALLEYGNNATVLTDFRKFRGQPFLENLVDNMAKQEDSQKRMDVALRTVKEKVFSLDGGMRQGHPRFIIFIVSDESTAEFDFVEGAGKELRDMDVTSVAIGTNRNVPDKFLDKLTDDSRFVYKADVANEMGGLVLGDLIFKMCKGNMSNVFLLAVFLTPRGLNNYR